MVVCAKFKLQHGTDDVVTVYGDIAYSLCALARTKKISCDSLFLLEMIWLDTYWERG